MAKLNLIQILGQTFHLDQDAICKGIEDHSQQQIDAREISIWITDVESVPSWANRAAALWIIEFWMNERDTCEAEGLLRVDEKYTRLLRDFSMGDIITMRSQLAQGENVS
jgi:hypothetical protein